MERRISIPCFYFPLWLIAFWPIGEWYLHRLFDASDEPWGLLALCTVICFMLRQRQSAAVGRHEVGLLPFVMLGSYVVTFPFMFPLFRAGLAVIIIGVTLSRVLYQKTIHLGLQGLLFLSLPILPSLQFVLGAPLRVLVAFVSAKLLQTYGYDVQNDGTLLNWQGTLVWVDAPCSGIRMLWTGLYCAFTFITFYNLQTARAIAGIVFSLVVIIVGNIVRATILFFVEAHIVVAPPSAHQVVGLVVFSLVCCLIFLFHTILYRPNVSGQTREKRKVNVSQNAYVICALLAALMPLVTDKPVAATNTILPPFQTTFEGQTLRSLPLQAREKDFLRKFPGHVGRFTDGKREIIQRYVSAPTRKLHPSADCFKGIGYEVHPTPARIDAQQITWGCFEAKKGRENLKVCEVIKDLNGNYWSDVSSWYWAALLGKTKGPWLAMTVAESNS